MSPERVAVLMATFNGARHVRAQIGSLHAQCHTHWRLWVADDGSQDDTLNEVREAAGRKLYRLTRGPGAGFAQNFLHLLRQVPDGHYAAFCDQDDIWFKDKLARALTSVRGRCGPAMICTGTLPCSDTLVPLANISRDPKPKRRLEFRNALGQNQASGNTIVLNPAAVSLLKPASLSAWAIPAHDWWVYQCLSAIDADIIYDPRPSLLYRQHDMNVIGANSGLRAKAARLARVIRGDYRRWMSANLAALSPLRDQMTSENRNLYDQISRTRGDSAYDRLKYSLGAPVRFTRPEAQCAWELAFVLGRV